MRITKLQLKQIIKEEVGGVVLDQQLDKGLKSLASNFQKQAQGAIQKGKDEEKVEEAVGVTFAMSIALAAPAIMNMVSGAAKLVNKSIKKVSGNESEAVKSFAKWMKKNGDSLHHKYTDFFIGIAKNVLMIKDERANDVGKAMYYLLVAGLAVHSGLAAKYAAQHAHVPLGMMEGALAAIKSGEVGQFLTQVARGIA